MHQGHIKLHRKLSMSSIWFFNPVVLKVFIACLMKANWKDTERYDKALKKGVTVARGSFVTSRRTFATFCTVSEQALRTALHILVQEGVLTHKSTHKSTQITVRNYAQYQTLPTQTSTQTSTHLSSDIKVVKDVKKLKKGVTEVTPESPVRAFQVVFHEALKVRLGDPVITFPWGHAGKLFKRLLSAHQPEEIYKRIAAWFDSTDPFIARNEYNLNLFEARFSLLKGGPIHAPQNYGARRDFSVAPTPGKYAHIDE